MSDRKKLTDGQVLPMQFKTATFVLARQAGSDAESHLAGASIVRAELDEEKRTIKGVSVSSDEPYERWFGTEILTHTAEAVNLDRVKAHAAPLLYNHDRDALLGKVSNPRLEDGRLLCDFKFSSSERGKQAMQDIKDGIMTECSIGYAIDKMESDEKEEIYTATRWTIHEVSLVTIPADFSVGVGRDAEVSTKLELLNASGMQKQVDKPNQKSDTPSNTKAMNLNGLPKQLHEKADEGSGGTAQVIDLGAERAKWETERDERAKKITDFSGKFQERHKKDLTGLRDAYLFGDKKSASFDDFTRDVLVGEFKAIPVPANFTGEIGANEKEVKRFSVLKAIRDMATTGSLEGLEKEMSEAAQKTLRREVKDAGAFIIPVEVTRQGQMEAMERHFAQVLHRAQSSAFAAGGATIAQEMQGLIEYLRNKSILGQMGITTLSGVVGDLVFPVQTGGATAYWVSETGALTDSEATFANKTMTPKRLGATVPVTKQLLAQSSISIENWLRNEIDKVTSLKADVAGLHGTGTLGEPLGIQNTTGINATVTFGGSAVWADIVEFETGIAVDNADIGSMQFALSAATVGKWKTILKDSVAGAGYLLERDMTANGYPVKRTNQISGNIAFFGVWSQLLRAIWAGRELIVDPYALKKSGQIEVTSNELTDYLCLQPLAFNVSTDTAAA